MKDKEAITILLLKATSRLRLSLLSELKCLRTATGTQIVKLSGWKKTDVDTKSIDSNLK